jgi:dihydrolipoamide dehydrogenase
VRRGSELPLPETNADTIYDVAVIGGGPAGYTAAIRGAEYGLKVALIDASPRLGGTCLHVGCIPTKALLFNAEIWDHLKHAEEYGIAGIGTPSLDWSAVLKRKDSIITRHVKGLEFLMKKHKIAVIPGYAKLTGAAKDGVHTVDVTAAGASSQVKAKNVILASGSEAKLLPGLKADDRILTNIEILSMTQPPKSLVIIGAGAVGVEFGSIFRSFGTEVTILEFLPRVVPVEDEEISKELTRVFKKRGIDINTGAKVEKVEKTESGVKVTFTDANGKPQVKEAEKVLVAVGRAPLTVNVGVEKTRIELDRGFVKVNEAQETAEPGIFAIGDIVAGLPQLAHVGAMSGMVAVAKDRGPQLPSRAARPHPRLHLHRTANRQRGPHRSPGQRKRPRSQGRQVSVRRQLKGHHRRQPRRLCEDRFRRQIRRDSRRAHHRPASHGADRRSRGRDGTRRHRRGDDVHHPRPPHAERSDAGRVRLGGRVAD